MKDALQKDGPKEGEGRQPSALESWRLGSKIFQAVLGVDPTNLSHVTQTGPTTMEFVCNPGVPKLKFQFQNFKYFELVHGQSHQKIQRQ